MHINEVSGVSKSQQLKSTQAPRSDGNPVSIHGDGLVESNDIEFAKNPFNKYNSDDFDRFNTILSGRNGAEAKETTDAVTNRVNNFYNDFKSKYPDAKLKFPEPPNPEDFPKGKKGYHAYEKALFQWENACLTAIRNEEARLQKEQVKTPPANPEPTPPKDDKNPPKVEEPPKDKSKNPPKENEPTPPIEIGLTPGKYIPEPGEHILEIVPFDDRKPKPSEPPNIDIAIWDIPPEHPINDAFKNRKF